MKERLFSIGIDIGGTNTKIGIFENSGHLLAFKSYPTSKDLSPEKFIEKIAQECFQQFCPDLELVPGDPRILGVGAGAPMANYFSGIIEKAPNLGWNNVPLKEYLEKYFKVNSFIENDANLAALGEKKWGAGVKFSDFVLITLGTGVGSGLILNNQLYRGHNGLGAEGGHIIIPSEAKRTCSCGGINHLESFLSAKGIKQTIQELTKENWSLENLGEEFHNSNENAILIMNKIAEELATGLASMAVLFGPESFIIGGGISKLGNQFNNIVLEKFNRIVHYSLKNKIQILNSILSSEKGAIFGGAALVLNEVANS